MKTLSIDIETYSDQNLATGGVYRYIDSPEFRILLFAYSVDGGPVEIVDFDNGDELPDSILSALFNPEVTKWAFNASFERVCLSAWARTQGLISPDEWLAPESWRCSMVWGSALGLPRSLDTLGQALKLESQKMREGKDLIKFFCVPPTPNAGRQVEALFSFDRPPRNTRGVAPKKWETFKDYCIRDVEVENAIRDKLAPFPLPDEVWAEYAMDQQVNDFGIAIDTGLAEQAIEADRIHREDCLSEARELTGLTNPNSVMQLQEWLGANGCPVPSLSKEDIADAVKTAPSPTVRRVLEIRQEISRSSVKKYQAMINATCSDGRAHGLIQFYGAGRTGRWAGRLIQVQNLPRNYLPDLADARTLLDEGHGAMLELLYGSLPDTLSQLIRTAFIPSDGRRFIVADYSAIEARVLAWLAGQDTTLQAFRDGQDLYCATASHMFGVPVEKHGANAELRQKGKVAVLACIAEGQRVLTDKGLVPIENITTDHKVWDGVEWVTHDGLINRGTRNVITYQGLTATPDHLVWINGQPEPIQLGDAATSRAHLTQSGAGRNPIRVGGDHLQRAPLPESLVGLLRPHQVHGVPAHPMDTASKPHQRALQGLPVMLTATADTTMARPETNSSKAALHQPRRPELQALRGARNRLQLHFNHRSGSLDHREPGIAPGTGARPHRQQRALRTREPSLGDTVTAGAQPAQVGDGLLEPGRMALRSQRGHTKIGRRDEPRRDSRRGGESRRRTSEKLARNSSQARVYDIANAGPRNRFTVEGRLVHNCGYQGGVGAIKKMGGERMGLSEPEMQDIVQAWRTANSNIVNYWWDIEHAAKHAIATGKRVTVGKARPVSFYMLAGVLFCELPSGRRLAYPGARITKNRFGKDSIAYQGQGLNRGLTTLETYGGKLVENITQAVARDLLAHALANVQAAGHAITMHIHDEIVVDAPPATSLREVVDLMTRAPRWADGLPLAANGYECSFYMKD